MHDTVFKLLTRCRLKKCCSNGICDLFFFLWLNQGILKGESGLFLTPVLMVWVAAILTVTYKGRVIVPPDLARSFCGIIRRNLRTLSLPGHSPRVSPYTYVIYVHVGKATHAQQTCLANLATKNLEVQKLTSICDGKMAATTDFPFEFPWTKHGTKN